MGEVIAIVSGKGGTGKTTLCAGIASCLAADGNKVLCIDADLGLRNLDLALGMADLAPIAFTDVLKGRYSLEEATEHSEIPGLFLLTAPVADAAEDIDRKAFAKLTEQAKEQFDFCLIDAPAGLGTGFELAAGNADQLLAVSTPDPASMRDAACTTDVLETMHKRNIRLIVNRITPKLFRKMHLTVDDVMDDVGLPLIGIVPEDPNVMISSAKHLPLILYSDQRAAVACLHIARRLEGQKVSLMKIR